MVKFQPIARSLARMIMDFRSDTQPEEEEKSYLEPHMDYSRASIIHTAINIIIYDSIAIFAVTSKKNQQQNLLPFWWMTKMPKFVGRDKRS